MAAKRKPTKERDSNQLTITGKPTSPTDRSR